MKYLFIFLPFFVFGQDTIVRGSDTVIIGRSYYDDHSFYKEWTRAGKHKDTPGGDSTLYGVRNDTMFVTGERFYLNGFESKSFYVSDRKPKVVESFKHAGAYYELRENGWYKEIDTIPDYLNGDIRIKGDSVFRFSKPEWTICDQHIGKSESCQREKVDTSEVKLLVWNGCSVAEVSATKYLFYNEMQVAKDTGGLAIYITETIKVDVIARYVSKDKWIKPSHVIKEL